MTLLRSPLGRSFRRGMCGLWLLPVSLLLMVVVSGCATAEAPARPVARVASAPQGAARTHVVVQGETLAGVAQQTGVPLQQLAALNQLADIDVIEVGQVLRLEEGPLPAADTGRFAQPEPDAMRELQRWVGRQWASLMDLTAEDITATISEYQSLAAENRGVAIGIAIPGVVIGAFLLWYLAVSALRVIRGAGRLAVGAIRAPSVPMAVATGAAGTSSAVSSGASQLASTEAASGSEPGQAERRGGGLGASIAKGARGLISLVGAVVHGLLSGCRAVVRSVGRGVTATWGAVVVPARARGRQRADEEAREAARNRWWQHGVETMRIGLLDEAREHFEAGLADAESHGWVEDVGTYREALAHIDELQRSRNMPPSSPSQNVSSGPITSSPAPVGPESRPTAE